jgi:hypothetical protein
MRGPPIECYLAPMAPCECQAAIFELPGNREALEVMFDTIDVPAQDRELMPNTLYAVLALMPGCVRVFRPASLEELLRVLDQLCRDAAPGMLHFWMKASRETEGRILAHMSAFPNQMTSARMH